VEVSFNRRSEILALEESIKGMDDTDWDARTQHHFSHGIYSREMNLDADNLVVGKLHQHSCTNFLLEGSVMVSGEFERDIYHAPCMWISCAGTKRAIYAITDCKWVTVHPNEDNTRDLALLESRIIAVDYAALETI
jgi:hypothetical protein